MPSGAAWRFGTGAQYQMTANSNIGLAVEYLTMESAKVNSSLFGGAYDNPDMWFFVTNLGYRF